MEAFGDGVVFGEAPHQSDGFDPLLESSGERLQGSQSGVIEVPDMQQECFEMLAALLSGLSFVLHEGSQSVHLLIDGFDGGILFEEAVSAQALLRSEFFRGFAQGGEAAAPVSDLRGDGAHELDTVLVDQANGVEAVGDDFGLGEPLANEPSVGTGQVDADQSDAFAAFESAQEAGQVFLTPAWADLEDTVIFQVAEGRAEALSLVQGMLVDAQIQGAVQTDAFTGLADGKLLVDPSDGGLTESMPPAQGTGTDALLVLLVDMIAEGLGAVPVRPHSGQFGHEAAPAAGALQAPRPDDQFALMTKAAQVPRPALIPPLTAGPRGPAVRARLRLQLPSKLDMHAHLLFIFYPEELVTLQTYS